jgi:hypothetical protein
MKETVALLFHTWPYKSFLKPQFRLNDMDIK